MRGRRIGYLGCLAGSLVFYFCYQQWAAWIILLTVAVMPLLSLALSIPAILRFRGEIEAPAFTAVGQPARAALWGLSRLPQPLFRGSLTVTHLMTGEAQRYDSRRPLPTDHCGGLRVSARRVRICDYLGLFAIPTRPVEDHTLIVRPGPVPMENPPDLNQFIARSWRPKFGGGFAENHELRPYRPGDSLNQIHWKLSAKTGELILREPMEPSGNLVLLTMDLSGTPEALDHKFGRLLWLSRHLLENGLRHEVRALTADGPAAFAITNEEELTAAVDQLLCAPIAREGTLADVGSGAAWHYHIGGCSHET